MEVVQRRDADMPDTNRSVQFTMNDTMVTPHELIKNLHKSFLQLEKTAEIVFSEVYEPIAIASLSAEFFERIKMWSATPNKSLPVETTIYTDSGVTTVRSIIYGKPK